MKVKRPLTKRYYAIGEVAEMFAVSNSLIRYWESEFTILKPQKNKKGDRRYTIKDIEQLEKIYTLVKERGFTLDGAKKELKRKPSDATSGSTDLKDKLEAILLRLQNIKDQLK